MKSVEQTRRDFLRMAGKGIVGAMALTAVPSVLTNAKAEGTEISAPAYPWKWQEVDKKTVMENTYKFFYEKGGCGAAVTGGILVSLADKYGYPYNQIHGEALGDFATGFGIGQLCGALGGACLILGLFCEKKEASELRDKLFDWYKSHPFPQYQPEMESITTVAESVLCADSVGKYCAATGYAHADAGRKARCAGLSAEVAEKTVELLNVLYGLEEAPVEEEAPAAEEALAENEYIGVGTSEIGGEIKVKVTMDGDKIAKIDVLSHKETAGISDPAFEQVPAAIIAANSTAVDTVSGATKTSEALIAAVNDALSQVKK